jgi:hypothetical protein
VNDVRTAQDVIASAILENFNPPDDRHSSWWISPSVSAAAVVEAIRTLPVEAVAELIGGQAAPFAWAADGRVMQATIRVER